MAYGKLRSEVGNSELEMDEQPICLKQSYNGTTTRRFVASMISRNEKNVLNT